MRERNPGTVAGGNLRLQVLTPRMLRHLAAGDGLRCLWHAIGSSGDVRASWMIDCTGKRLTLSPGRFPGVQSRSVE